MDKTESVDVEELIERAMKDGAKPLSDFVQVVHAVQWLQILAVPRIFRGMTRSPPRAHLVAIVDVFLASVLRGERDTHPEFSPVPYEERERLALRLRELLASWTPPDLPTEITEAARAVLYADGMKGGPAGWDNLPDPDMRPEEYLLWPEGVPALLKSRARRAPEESGDR